MKKLPKLRSEDKKYLAEVRDFQTNGVENDLSFYYSYKDAMQEILTDKKKQEFKNASIVLGANDTITASLRRPFKKGSREYGKGSNMLYIKGVQSEKLTNDDIIDKVVKLVEKKSQELKNIS